MTGGGAWHPKWVKQNKRKKERRGKLFGLAGTLLTTNPLVRDQ